jgi:hypothetical protein
MEVYLDRLTYRTFSSLNLAVLCVLSLYVHPSWLVGLVVASPWVDWTKKDRLILPFVEIHLHVCTQ